jgi:hypothetical protein
VERKVVDSILVTTVGEYGIVRVVEQLLWNNGKVFRKQIIYDVCLKRGDGDIVASFNKSIDARKWAKEN